MAADGDLRLHPLWAEHLQRHGMGLWRHASRNLQPIQPRLRAMGADLESSRHERRHPHRETSRRLLSLAYRDHGLFHQELTLQRRPWRRGRRVVRSLP